jgi:hypothetical protein
VQVARGVDCRGTEDSHEQIHLVEKGGKEEFVAVVGAAIVGVVAVEHISAGVGENSGAFADLDLTSDVALIAELEWVVWTVWAEWVQQEVWEG